MSKQFNKSCLYAMLFVAPFSAASFTAYAAAPLQVEFVPDPLFEKANFLPGDSADGEVRVTNNTNEEQQVITEAINAADEDALGGRIKLVIKGNLSGVLFNETRGTLGDFLRAGEVPLGTLAPGASEIYYFSTSFLGESGNSYTGKKLGFDLCVGFEGGSSNCGTTEIGEEGEVEISGGNTGPPKGSGGGGGSIVGSGGPASPPLQLQGEEVAEVDEGAGSVVIEWTTNYLSTSQIIYGAAASGPYSLNLTVLPYFGYPLGTVEDTKKVTEHSVEITGLAAGEKYLFRVVSRASPPTVGFEHSFIVSDDFLSLAVNGSGFSASGAQSAGLAHGAEYSAPPPLPTAPGGRREGRSGAPPDNAASGKSAEAGAADNFSSEKLQAEGAVEENAGARLGAQQASAESAPGSEFFLSYAFIIFAVFFAIIFAVLIFRKKQGVK